MKNSILKITVLFVSLFFFTNAAVAQSCCDKKLANCPKKGQKDCPIVQNCPKKGTAECDLVKTDNKSTAVTIENCPLAGTADCPLVKNCPLKGTADCPYANKTSNGQAVANTDKKEEVPACCKKHK